MTYSMILGMGAHPFMYLISVAHSCGSFMCFIDVSPSCASCVCLHRWCKHAGAFPHPFINHVKMSLFIFAVVLMLLIKKLIVY